MGTELRREAAGATGRRRAVRAADLAARVHGGAGVAVTGDYLGARGSPEGGRAAGLDRNARGYAECLAAVPGEVGVLIEGTAGAGTALGATFEELRALRDALPAATRGRAGFCLDTAHLHAAGYDVAGDPEGVWERLDREVGLTLLKCLHLNDSKAAPGSRLDRHEWIGEGTIGAESFRRLMRDPRFRRVIKIIETPKGDEPVRHDRRMLRRLRAYARGARPETPTMELA